MSIDYYISQQYTSSIRLHLQLLSIKKHINFAMCRNFYQIYTQATRIPMRL